MSPRPRASTILPISPTSPISPPTTRYPLPTTHYPLPITHYPLPSPMPIETPNQPMTAESAKTLLREGLSCRVDSDLPPQFQTGDWVKAKIMHPKTYTRLPRYIRGKVGNIIRDHGVYVFPDTLGQRLSTKPQHVYSVRFSAQELWGMDAPPNDALYIDLFDDHLEAL